MSIKVLAGDWAPGTGCSFVYGVFGSSDRLRIGFLGPEFAADAVTSIETLNERNKTSILGKAGWGLAGLALLGPFGMLAGMLGGGNRHEKVVALELADGRRALLHCDAKNYALMMRLAFKPGVTPTQKPEPRPIPDLTRPPAPIAAEGVVRPMEPVADTPDFMRGLTITYGDGR